MEKSVSDEVVGEVLVSLAEARPEAAKPGKACVETWEENWGLDYGPGELDNRKSHNGVLASAIKQTKGRGRQ